MVKENQVANPDQNQKKKLTSSIEFTGTMYPVYSSKFKAIGFMYSNEYGGVLQVEFNKGIKYQYAPVPKALFSEVFASASKGTWFTEKIQKNEALSYVKVGTNKLEL